MVVDLDAFDANAADLARRAGATPLRVATKSLRVPALVARALAADGFSGAMGYSLREALWLHEQGLCSDIVLGYPTVDRAALERLVSSPSAAAAITLMVDCVEHLDVVDSVRSSKAVGDPGRDRPRRRPADGWPARRPEAVAAARRTRHPAAGPHGGSTGVASRWSG